MTTGQQLPIDTLHQASVTRFDAVTRPTEEPADVAGGAVSVWFPKSPGRLATNLPMDLPPRWSRVRDYALLAALEHNDMWASSVARAITRQVARGWDITDTAQREPRTRRAQALLLQANRGRGWAHYLGQQLGDFLSLDNGCFTEILWSTLAVRRGSKGQLLPVGRILGIQHLDSVRCTRLHDDDLTAYAPAIARRWGLFPHEVTADLFPVLYTDMAGRGHLLFRWQVIDLVDMPSGRIEHRGTGLCAASRAYRTIHTTTGLERYIDEKVTGERVLEIHLVNGIQTAQMEQALSAAAEQQRARGLRQFRGVVVVPALKMDVGVGGYRIPIAEVPDGFSAREEREEARIKFANALGIPVRDLQPAPAGLNSGATALIEAERAEGAGLAAWAEAFAAALNQWVLPASTVFRWAENTVRDEKDRAEVLKLRAEARKVMVKDTGEISAAQALQLAADAGDVPMTFLPRDETPNATLADDEKPVPADASSSDPDGDGVTRLGELLGWTPKERRVIAPDSVDDDVIVAAVALRQEVGNAAGDN
jgi:hypothetical protein